MIFLRMVEKTEKKSQQIMEKTRPNGLFLATRNGDLFRWELNGSIGFNRISRYMQGGAPPVMLVSL